MSLWLHRRAIAQAVIGDLPVTAEARLRAHMHRCVPCHRYYDQLSLVNGAGAQGGAQGGAQRMTAAGRERSRLLLALDRQIGQAQEPAAAVALSPARRMRFLPVFLPALLVPVAVAVLVVVRAPTGPQEAQEKQEAHKEQEQVTWRGIAPPAEPAPIRLLVYASRKQTDGAAGPVRLLGEIPASGEIEASLGDYLQLGYRDLASAAHVMVVARDAQAGVIQYVPRSEETPARLDPSPDLRTMGPSIDLAIRHQAGRMQLYVLVSEQPLDPLRVRDAVARGPDPSTGRLALDADAKQLVGVMTIK
jgi:hypothetical protein